MRPRRAAPAAAALLLAGCCLTGCGLGSDGRSATSGAAAQGGGAPGDSALPTLPAVADGEQGTPVAPPSSPAATDAPPEVVLQGDGLGLVDADASVVPLAFGAPGATVRQALETSLGPTTVDTVLCPQGPRTTVDVDGFRALLDGDRFAGWTDRGAPDRSTTTAEGAGAGSKLQDLQSALPGLQVAPPPPGTAAPATWTSPSGLSGTLEGVDPASRVTALSAGQTCPG